MTTGSNATVAALTASISALTKQVEVQTKLNGVQACQISNLVKNLKDNSDVLDDIFQEDTDVDAAIKANANNRALMVRQKPSNGKKVGWGI